MFVNKELKSNKFIKPILLILIIAMTLFTGCGDDDNIPDTDGQINVENVENEVKSEDIFNDSDKDVASIEGDIEVHFIDVGQGDAVLIKQDGSNMLIDAGENHYGGLVVDYLKEQGVEDLEYVIGTHPHSDHIGGLDDVINNFPVEKVIMPDVIHTSKTFEDVLLAVENNGLKLTKPVVGDTFQLGKGEFTIIGPNSEDYGNLNDYSVMLRLSFGESSFMLTGDAEETAEGEAVANGENIKSDLLKAGHHGSDTSTTDRFLNDVDPDYAVIQVGEGNQYHHPSQSVITKLKDRGVKVYRTDVEGNIIAKSDGNSISIKTTKSKVPQDNVTENYEDAEESVEKEEIKDTQYIGNKNSKVLHKKDCGHLPDEHNRVYFDIKDEGLGQGYKPCGFCKP